MTKRNLMNRRPNMLAVLTLAGAFAATGCDDADRTMASKSAMVAPAPEAAEPQSGEEDNMLAADKPEAKSRDSRNKGDAAVVRKLIQTAELHVEVSSYASARGEIEKNLSELGGFIADVSVQHSEGSVSHADLVVRVPSDKLDDFLAGTAGHGDVVHETVRSKDITEGYYDVKARLKNAKRLEARLLSLLDERADNVTSLLEVERELARVRGQVEGFEGKIRLWDNQVNLSTVKLRLVTRQVYAASEPKTLGGELGETLGSSLEALQGFGLGLLFFAVALVPWLIPMGLLFYALRAMFRWMKRRRADRRATPMGGPGIGPAVHGHGVPSEPAV